MLVDSPLEQSAHEHSGCTKPSNTSPALARKLSAGPSSMRGLFVHHTLVIPADGGTACLSPPSDGFAASLRRPTSAVWLFGRHLYYADVCSILQWIFAPFFSIACLTARRKQEVKLDKAEAVARRRFAALLPLTEPRQGAGRDNGPLHKSSLTL